MDFRFIRRKPKDWPYAAGSTGRPRGPLKTNKGRLLVFEARGPAREKFTNDISDAILKHLRDSSDQLQDSATYVGLSLFMMGKSPERTEPVVMFVSDDKNARMEALQLVKDSGIMDDFPGFGLSQMSLRAEFENLRPLGSHATQTSSMGARGASQTTDTSFYAPDRLIDVFGNLDRVKPILEVAVNGASAGTDASRRFATPGGIVIFRNEFLVHTVSHFLKPSATPPSLAGERDGRFSELEESDDECEIIGLGDSEDEDDDMAEITSRGSVTPSVSDFDSDPDYDIASGSERSDRHSEASFEDREVQTSYYPRPDMTLLGGSLSERFVTGIKEPLPMIGSVVETSEYLDSSFIRLDTRPQPFPCSVIPLKSYHNYVETAPSDAAVYTRTRRGVICGQLSGTPFFVRLPGTKDFQEVHTVKLDAPLTPGDCGCWIKNSATGKLYGHVVAGSTTSGLALVMPAARVFAQLLERLSAKEDSDYSATDSEPSTTLNTANPVLAQPTDVESQDSCLRYGREPDPWIRLWSPQRIQSDLEKSLQHRVDKAIHNSSTAALIHGDAAFNTYDDIEELDLRPNHPKHRRTGRLRNNLSPSLPPLQIAIAPKPSPTDRAIPVIPQPAPTDRAFLCRELDYSELAFTDQVSLDAHTEKTHSRPFICIFHFAGCDGAFSNKNEWKRHVNQHVVNSYRGCREGGCAEPPAESDPGENDEIPPSSAIFNRKDLFMQHMNRMEPPLQLEPRSPSHDMGRGKKPQVVSG